MGDDRPSVYLENGVAVYRASAVGGCTTALLAARLGYTPKAAPDMMERAAEEGNLHEPDILRKLEKEYGFVAEETQVRVESWLGEKVLIRGSTDGKGKDAFVECKSMSDKRFKQWVRSEFDNEFKYACQFTVYMDGLQMPGWYAVKNRNTGELWAKLYETPPLMPRVVRQRVLKVEQMARSKQGLPECKGIDWPCPYYYLHTTDENHASLGVVQGSAELEDLLARHHELSARIEELTDEKTQLSDRIKSEYPVGTMSTDKFEMVISKAPNNRFNSQKLKRDRPELYDEYMEHRGDVLRLTVKPK